VHEVLPFLLFAPSAEQCQDINDICPEIGWPSISTTAPLRAQPSAFYKLSMHGSHSFHHEVEMEPTALPNFFVISFVPIEAGGAFVTMRVDFEGCQGRDMLGLNPVDFLIFDESLSPSNSRSTKETQAMMKPYLYSNTSDDRFRGCRKISNLKLPVSYPIHINAKHNTAAQIQEGCDFSLLRGGWWLNEDFPVAFDTPCRPSKLNDKASYQLDSDLMLHPRVSASSNATFRSMCMIGDSHLNRFWKTSWENRLSPSSGSAILSGGGIDFDGGRKWYNWQNVSGPGGRGVSGSRYSILDGEKIIVGQYSIPDLIRTRNTTGISEAVVYSSHNPWDPCVDLAKYHQRPSRHNPNPDTSPKDTIVFHAGSHNSGGSNIEGFESVTKIVQRFETWAKHSPAKQKKRCLIIVSSNDCFHEKIIDVKHGKFNEQQHFRNSWRIASFNQGMRDAVDDMKRKRRENNEIVPNVHYLDAFHMSLGLHWLGHSNDPVDPVHFTNNAFFADLAFLAVKELCGS
jgi:hypothetical protein